MTPCKHKVFFTLKSTLNKQFKMSWKQTVLDFIACCVSILNELHDAKTKSYILIYESKESTYIFTSDGRNFPEISKPYLFDRKPRLINVFLQFRAAYNCCGQWPNCMGKYVCSGVNALQQTAHWAILLGTNRSYVHTAFVCITWLSSHALCWMRFSACISARVFTTLRRFAWTFFPSSVASELSDWPIDRFLRYVCLFVPILVTAPLCWSVSFCKHVSSIGESDSLCPMQWRRRYWDSRLFETRSRQGIWEVTLYNLLPSTLASHVITLNGTVYRPLAQTATCLYHDEETNISQKTVDRSVRQQLARDTTRKKGPRKPTRSRKYTRRNAGRKTHPAQGVTAKSRDTYKRSVNMNGLCPAGWLDEQSIAMRWFHSIRTCPHSWATGRNTIKGDLHFLTYSTNCIP